MDIRNRLDQERQTQVLENRQRLVPILKTIILHGQQNIPLRGHRDDGPLLGKDGEFSLVGNNDGCFRALLRFRIDAGDVQLKEHLKNTGARATYISKNIANELIECCGQEILFKIVSKIHEAEFYSIIFDETTDISRNSQLSLSARYVYNNRVEEQFLGFFDLHKLNYESAGTSDSDTVIEPKITGTILGQSVVKQMKSLGLHLDKCIGIGCDSCSVNMSEVKGAAQEIQKEAKNARICPCFNHSLNLVISQSLKVQSVKNSMGTIQEIVTFFQLSAKRNFVLEKYLKCKLKSPCQTRWIERHDSILQFATDLPPIAEALREISQWDDNTSSSKANILLKATCDCEFILTIFCLSDVFSVTLPFSKYLQSYNIELASATVKVNDLLQVLEQKRANANDYFPSTILKQAQKILSELEVELKIPRLCARQTKRDSFTDYKDLSPTDYWRRVIYIPVLDYLITDLRNRFNEKNMSSLYLNSLIPSNLKEITSDETLFNNLSSITREFGDLLGEPSVSQLMGEVQLYKQGTYSTNNALEALQNCDALYFPNIYNIFKILCTFTISVATAERSFSTLRLLKTYLRSTMLEDRLNGLSLLYMHRNIDLDINEIINRFAYKKRRMEFVI